MSAAPPTLAKPLLRLRSRMIRTARGFHDYNFRQYFIQHIKDDFSALSRLPAEEQKKFLHGEGLNKLKQMQRMVVVNQMYSRQPVFFDRYIPPCQTGATSPSRPTIQ